MGKVRSKGLHVIRGLSHALLTLLCKALSVQAQDNFFCCFHHGLEDGQHRLQGYALDSLQRRPEEQLASSKGKPKWNNKHKRMLQLCWPKIVLEMVLETVLNNSAEDSAEDSAVDRAGNSAGDSAGDRAGDSAGDMLKTVRSDMDQQL